MGAPNTNTAIAEDLTELAKRRLRHPTEFVTYVEELAKLAEKAITVTGDPAFVRFVVDFCKTPWPGLGFDDITIADTPAKIWHLENEVPAQILRDSILAINANVKQQLPTTYMTTRGPTWEVKTMPNIVQGKLQATVGWVVVVDEGDVVEEYPPASEGA